MAIHRTRKQKGFTRIANTPFHDKRLSLKEIGLLCLMLSLPNNWRFSVNGLVSLTTDGKKSVRNAVENLEKFGYLKREESRQNGQFYYEWEVYNEPIAVAPLGDAVNRTRSAVHGGSDAVQGVRSAVHGEGQQEITEQKGKKEKNKINNQILNYPNMPERYFDDDSVNSIFIVFLDDLKERDNGQITKNRINTLVEKVKMLSGGNADKAIKIIKASIEHGWKTVYELKESQSKQESKSAAAKWGTAHDELEKEGTVYQ